MNVLLQSILYEGTFVYYICTCLYCMNEVSPTMQHIKLAGDRMTNNVNAWLPVSLPSKEMHC
jgi:hypothetical protein